MRTPQTEGDLWLGPNYLTTGRDISTAIRIRSPQPLHAERSRPVQVVLRSLSDCHRRVYWLAQGKLSPRLSVPNNLGLIYLSEDRD